MHKLDADGKGGEGGATVQIGVVRTVFLVSMLLRLVKYIAY